MDRRASQFALELTSLELRSLQQQVRPEHSYAEGGVGSSDRPCCRDLTLRWLKSGPRAAGLCGQSAVMLDT